MRARLVSTDGGPTIDLIKDLTLIGRDEDCDVRLEHKSVSKLHCILVMSDGMILLRDLGSTNGTRVNGQKVRRAALLPNDSLAVANLKYQVKYGIDLAPDVPAPSGSPEVVDKPASIRLNALPDVYPEAKTPRS